MKIEKSKVATTIILLVLLGVYGCIDYSTLDKKDIPIDQGSNWWFNYELMQSKYYFDERTGLCFLVGASGHAAWYTEVPCSEKVLSIVINKEPKSKIPVEINGKKYIEVE